MRYAKKIKNVNGGKKSENDKNLKYFWKRVYVGPLQYVFYYFLILAHYAS